MARNPKYLQNGHYINYIISKFKKICTPQAKSKVARSIKKKLKISDVAIARELKEAGIGNVHAQILRNCLLSLNF